MPRSGESAWIGIAHDHPRSHVSAIPSARFPSDRRSEVGGKLGEAAGCRGVVDVDKYIYMSTVHVLRAFSISPSTHVLARVRNCFYNISRDGNNGACRRNRCTPIFLHAQKMQLLPDESTWRNEHFAAQNVFRLLNVIRREVSSRFLPVKVSVRRLACETGFNYSFGTVCTCSDIFRPCEGEARRGVSYANLLSVGERSRVNRPFYAHRALCLLGRRSLVPDLCVYGS